MATNYPAGLDTFTAKTNAVDNVDASHVNNLQDAVEAIQGELGTNPSGASATVKARLDALDSTVAGKLATSGTAADSAKIGGVTVTGTPTTGQVLKATSGTAATWQAETGGGGASAPTVTVVSAASTAQTLTAPSNAEAIVYDITLNAASCALTLVGAQTGKRVVIEAWLRQDATGGRVVTWPNNIRWSTAVAPVLSSLPNRTDVVQLVSTDAGTTWYGALAGSGFAAQALPAAPTSPASAASSGKITVAWAAPIGSVPAVTAYKLYRGTVSGTLTLLATLGNVTTYDDSAVTGGTTYYYKVSAVNSVGEGPQSSETSATASSVGSLPSTGTAATLWFTAESITGVSNGATVATWPDSSATGAAATNASSGSRPTFQTNVVNGKPVVRFIAGNLLQTNGAIAGNAGHTLFVVAKASASGTQAGMFGGPNGGLELLTTAGGNLGANVAFTSTLVNSTAAVPNLTTAWHVLSTRAAAYSGSARAVDVEIDGTRTATTSSGQITTTAGPQYIGIGGGNSPGTVDRFAGDIAEIIYYPAALSDTDYDTVKDYLAAKYGITVV